MRQIIVKHFALYHDVMIRGKKISFLRASIPVWNSLLLMILVVLKTDYPVFDWVDWLATIPFIVSVFFGFVYFKFKPIKWNELDDEQKWQYGKINPIRTNSFKGLEWHRIDKKFKKIKNRKIGYLLINFITFLIVVGLLIK